MSSVIENILQQREVKNEKRVAVVRFIMGLLGIREFLIFFGVIQLEQETPNAVVLISVFLLIYSLSILLIVFFIPYIRSLKYFVIFFDYVYVVLNFIYDPQVTGHEQQIVWYALTAVVMFYFINLLRYSLGGTIFAGILSILVYGGVNIYFSVPASDMSSVGIALLLILLIGYIISTSNKKMMVEANAKRMMERYLPPQLVGEMYGNKASLEPGGKSQNATVLFSDIRSFTSLSESMEPSEVVSLLNQYLSEMTEIIFAHQGTIDKFIGDAIMTIFGAPIEGEDDAIRAVETAIEMHKALKGQTLQVGIGIHTGEVIAGNIGSEKRLDYTVIGDTVNLSSRIQGLCNFYSASILISESTFKELEGHNEGESYCIREVDHVIVKGKTKGVRIYEVLYFDNAQKREESYGKKETFEKALVLYRKRQFKEAFAFFKQLNQDKLSQIYMKRCRQYYSNPPGDDWNGTFTMISK